MFRVLLAVMFTGPRMVLSNSKPAREVVPFTVSAARWIAEGVALNSPMVADVGAALQSEAALMVAVSALVTLAACAPVAPTSKSRPVRQTDWGILGYFMGLGWIKKFILMVLPL